MAINKITKYSWAYLNDIYDYARARTAALFKTNHVRRRWDGDISLNETKRVAVFNHFDMHGIIHDYVEHYIREIQKAGFAVIFTSNSPKFPESSVEKLKPLVSKIIWRANVGYDFGAFKDGIAAIPDSRALDMLLVTNDSMYGPLRDLSDIIAESDPAEADVWGITDCWDRQFHLQSYFLLFHPTALRSKAFQQFWKRLPYYQRKRWVVRYGEIGLTPYLQRFGLRCQALVPYRQTVRTLAPRIEEYLETAKVEDDPIRYRYLETIARAIRDGVPLNQTHFFWDHLLGPARCPFIKRDLLQHNPMAIPFLHHWERILAEHSSYDSRLIVRHLERTMRNRVY